MRSALIYILATLLANYTAAIFLPLPVPGIAQPILISVGTLFFGLTFTQRDRVHRYGRPAVYAMIFAAGIANIIMSIVLAVPWRIILASFITILIAETADTEVYQRYLARPWFERVVRSNAVSIPIDSLLFPIIAFAGEPGFPPMVILAIAAGDIVLKMVISLLSAVWRAEK